MCVKVGRSQFESAPRAGCRLCGGGDARTYGGKWSWRLCVMVAWRTDQDTDTYMYTGLSGLKDMEIQERYMIDPQIQMKSRQREKTDKDIKNREGRKKEEMKRTKDIKQINK